MKKYIFGNFKMNMNLQDTEKYIEKLLPLVNNTKNDVVIFPSFVNLMFASQKLTSSKIGLGAQNVSSEQSGAYTGEVSSEMLKSVGVSFVLVGHSERRKLFLEKNETINKKIIEALRVGLKVVLCVGETKYERASKKVEQVLEKEVLEALKGLYENELKNIIIAYEPVWAIGTGLAATNEDAQEVHAMIRGLLKKLYECPSVADETRILYGGSMNDANAAGLLAQPDIDGGLIGGAALKPDKFATIIKAALGK